MSSNHEERIGEIIASWLDLRDAGNEQRPEEILARYPEFEKELRKFFENDAFVRGVFKTGSANPMTFEIGAKLGPYQITGHLGRGGMGEVYRARDSRLKTREVAIKVLPERFARDPDRLARFQREADILASLNHPNIGAIYHPEDFEAVRFLVLELVEGETLAERIAHGRIPIDKALPIARQIVDALEAAHEKRIIHRDLKPGNIKVAPDGKVKILDFGLARMHEAEGDPVNSSNRPTAKSEPGLILGTAAYMSPEQATGQEADRTFDVWAFGCVLYEMLSGKAAFDGRTASEIHAAILKTDPDWRRLPQGTPEGIRRLLRWCLWKDRKLRLRDIADARIEIEDVLTEPIEPKPSRKRQILWITSLLSFFAVTVGTLVWNSIPVPEEQRTHINTPQTDDPVSIQLSPDGRNVAFVAISEGRPRLWLQRVGSLKAKALAETNGGLYPFWSPDSRHLGFAAEGQLKRIDIDNDLPPQVLASVSIFRGGTWNRQDVILFGTGAGPILRVSANEPNGKPVEVTPKGGSHRFPQFLPDGRHFIYYATPDGGVYVGDLLGSAPRLLRVNVDGAAVYAASGLLLFVSGGALYAQDLDLAELKLTGDPFQVDDHVAVDKGSYAAALSASASGPIAYRKGAACGERQLKWYNRKGDPIRTAGNPDAACSLNPSLSADESQVVLSRNEEDNTDIYLLELEHGRLNRLTSGAATDLYPIWSPKDKNIVFASNRGTGLYDLYRMKASGESEELLLTTEHTKIPSDLSQDGKSLIYRTLDRDRGWDLWYIPFQDGKYGSALPLVQTEFEERDAQFSPDGKWVAYQANDSGHYGIYLQRFPTGRKAPVSTEAGGAQVRWRRDGKELFYIALDGWLMAVDIEVSSDGELKPGQPHRLFETQVGGAVDMTYRQQYMVSSDGQQFLMNTLTEKPPSPIVHLRNWKP